MEATHLQSQFEVRPALRAAVVTISATAPAYTRPRTYTYYGALWTMGVKGTF